MTLELAVPTTDEEHAIKREKVLAILDDKGHDALLLRSAAAVNWYLEGARTHVSLAADPVVAIRITREHDEILATDNEIERLRAEELPSGAIVVTRAWHEPLMSADALDEKEVEAELRAARRVLLPLEAERYRRLCADTAALLTDALHAATPDQTELDLAADLAGRVTRSGSEALVVLVGGASRSSYRHPLPTLAPLGRYVMAVVCARRHGLIANVTRIVRFGSATLQERRAEHGILQVEADVLDALRHGQTLGFVLGTAARGYPRHGFDSDEWLRHHQGGAAGYAGRDPRATPESPDRVAVGQAFAWNPSCYRAKVEDTVLLTPEGIEVLSTDPRWPSRDVRGRRRPDVLVR
ncbi:M24 family metallopeptidase [Rathayibacter sp. VKM Ac-2835]|uniref:M24 family metallopeptidase n=1 Tax=Rathayibacter sp. VKM Ac-2835 TaxID=2739043 RepID=UPI0015634DF1|nr:M24 family metallopeptidase [Rathayibacter sp. VKM Ac-2835]NRG43040.1 M24 family metallopeptidase [Rathayibacter sp. VKM Ac-2835]